MPQIFPGAVPTVKLKEVKVSNSPSHPFGHLIYSEAGERGGGIFSLSVGITPV